MLEAPEIEAHHHKTGHGKADLILALLAVALSGVSVFIAINHGHTMERLVAANSWPNLSFGTGNSAHSADPDKPGDITFTLRNTGVGPARIDSVELFYKGVAQPNALAFLKSCCSKDKVNYGYSVLTDEVLPARDSIDFLTVPRANAPGVWEALNAERLNARLRICYCSVFDECFVRDTEKRRPERVAQCVPSQPITYR
jgi:hypothetical protein